MDEQLQDERGDEAAGKLDPRKETGSVHVLRHSFCSRLAMAGASTEAIQGLASHEQVSTTQRYMHLSPAAKNEAISLLDRSEDLKAEGEQDANATSFAPEFGSGRGAGVERKGSVEGA